MVRRRLWSHHLAGRAFDRPEEVVRWFGAVQAQEYPGAKWALAQRLSGSRDADLDAAFAGGAMLRTHVMRPTWHFVAPEDLRWLLKLTAPRVHAANAQYYRAAGLDEALLARTNEVVARALEGGKQLTRSEIGSALARAGIPSAEENRYRLGYIMMYAELDGIVCSGGLRGKQHTYALLDERVPPVRALDREEALAELARRYFTGHGPATVQDCAWWSGLTVPDVRAGLEAVRSELEEEVVDGATLWFSPDRPGDGEAGPAAHLLPAYDEYTVGYRDRGALVERRYLARTAYGLGMVLLIDGRVAGTWKRTLRRDAVLVEAKPFHPLQDAESRAVAAAARLYGTFLDRPVVLG